MARRLLLGPSMSLAHLEHAEISEVIDRVLEDHISLREQLDAAVRLARRHGDPELLEPMEALASELQDHMVKEERVLLPWIRAGRGATASAPIRAMLREHEQTLEWVARLREVTGGYASPSVAVAPLYGRLQALEVFLREHIALENDVLFPRALRG